jgi:glycosyltransferase involved in cell wall biosynthesis
MKIVVGIATFKGREEFLKKTIDSLKNQVDEINVYDNEINPDLTDNGKFYFLHKYKEPIYYLSCDDDIIYPPTYAQDMIKAINECNSIVTHHGRKLVRKGVSYYKGHTTYRCTGLVNKKRLIDVGGTGVTGFRTDYFNPIHIYKSEHKKMSDLVFALEARKQKKLITLITHKTGYIIAQPVPREQTIFGNHKDDDAEQSTLADEIQSLSS